MPFIEFDRVSKIYSRQSREFFWRFLLEALGKNKAVPHYALRDVTFRIEAGEAIGIVGANGAGKTTLLNLVAGLTIPEKGIVHVQGRVSAMMELGSGFHPDLTAAENLRINAALQGLTKSEVDRAFDGIVDFAELGGFIREPLRIFSQGMILRLAFAVAVHSDPDILLVDELLAVGDESFQQKCYSHVLGMKREGKILMCVSHFPDMLEKVCERAMWLEGGSLVMTGPLAQVAAEYRQRESLPAPTGRGGIQAPR